MALVIADRVQELSSTAGTGTLTLSGAVVGYRTFAAGVGVGNTCYYTITSPTGAWEVGIGTVGTGTLARTTLLSSSTGSLVSFTGTLNVFVTYPAERAVYQDASTGNATAPVFTATAGFVMNPNTISSDFTVPTGMNAASTGPITQSTNIVTIPAGAVWQVN
jgi:hypothetical protein